MITRLRSTRMSRRGASTSVTDGHHPTSADPHSGAAGTSRRRTTTKLVAVLGVGAMLVAACGSKDSGGGDKGSSKGPLKIGLLNTMSGPFADLGKDGLIGAKIAVDEINAGGGINGQKVELVVKDEKFSATATVQAMREFASSGVKIVVGFDSSADCLAAVPVAVQNKMIIIAPTCSADEVTQKGYSDRLFAISANTSMFGKGAAVFANNQLKDVKTWDNLTFDYITGHQYWDGFQAAMKASNSPAKYGKSLFVPTDTSQWAPYITAMASAGGEKPKGLFSFMFPASLVSFFQQAKQYDFASKYSHILLPGAYEQVTASVGADAPETYFVYDYYFEAFNNPVNTRLVEAFKKDQPNSILYGPNTMTYQNYTALLAVKAGIEKAGSADPDQMIKVLPGLHFDSPKGDVYFRKDHLLAAPIAAFKCVGDASAPKKYKCPFAVELPAEEVLPPITAGG